MTRCVKGGSCAGAYRAYLRFVGRFARMRRFQALGGIASPTIRTYTRDYLREAEPSCSAHHSRKIRSVSL